MNSLKPESILGSLTIALSLTAGVGNAIAKTIESTPVASISCDEVPRLSRIEELYECAIRKGILEGKMAHELPDDFFDEEFLDWFIKEKGEKNYLDFYPPHKGRSIYRLFQDITTKRFWIFLVSDEKPLPKRRDQEGG